MNSKEFADDFQCKKGSAMNPKEKCKVWASPNTKSSSKFDIKLPSPYEESEIQSITGEPQRNKSETLNR